MQLVLLTYVVLVLLTAITSVCMMLKLALLVVLEIVLRCCRRVENASWPTRSSRLNMPMERAATLGTTSQLVDTGEVQVELRRRLPMFILPITLLLAFQTLQKLRRTFQLNVVFKVTLTFTVL